MMFFYSINVFMSVVLALIHFTLYTSAYWLHEPFGVPPPTPGEDETLTCYGWIMFYNFGLDAAENEKLAKNRDKQFDENVEEYAVIYAHVLEAFSGSGIGPQEYCFHYYSGDTREQFKPLKSTLQNCESWILQYGYSLHTGDNKKNRERALSRNKNEDLKISAFAAGYAQFIERKKQKSNPISVRAYCHGMSLGFPLMPFMSFSGTTKPCKEWINLSGYGDDTYIININISRLQNKKFLMYLNVFTKHYIEYLQTYTPKTNFFCQSSTSVLDGIPLTPAEFCDREGYRDVPRTYYNIEAPN